MNASSQQAPKTPQIHARRSRSIQGGPVLCRAVSGRCSGLSARHHAHDPQLGIRGRAYSLPCIPAAPHTGWLGVPFRGLGRLDGRQGWHLVEPGSPVLQAQGSGMAVAGIRSGEAMAQGSRSVVSQRSCSGTSGRTRSGRALVRCCSVTDSVTRNLDHQDGARVPPPYNNRGTRFNMKQNIRPATLLLARLSGHFRPLKTVPHSANGFASR